MNITMLILLYTAAAVIASRLPFVRFYLSLCNTLIYEVTCALCLKDKKIKLTKNGASSADSFLLRSAISAYAGYTAASLAAIGLFHLITKGQENLVLYIIIGFMLVTLLLWIRTIFGVIWTLSFISLLALPIYFRWETAIIHIGIFLACNLFVGTVMRSFLLLKQSIDPNEPSARLKTIIPAALLSLVLLIQSLYAGYFIFTTILS